MDFFATLLEEAFEKGEFEPKKKPAAKPKKVAKSSDVLTYKLGDITEQEPEEIIIADLTKQPGREIIVFQSYRAQEIITRALLEVDKTGTVEPYVNTERGYFILKVDENIDLAELRRVFFKMDCGGLFLNVQQLHVYEQKTMVRERDKNPESKLYGKMTTVYRDYQKVDTKTASSFSKEPRKGTLDFNLFSITDKHSPVLTMAETERLLIDVTERGQEVGK